MLILAAAAMILLGVGKAGAGAGEPSGIEALGLRYELRELKSPRALRVHCLRADLASGKVDPRVVLAPDPDQDGPAEAALTSPLALVSNRPVVAFVNASRWDGLPDAAGNRDRAWRDGQPVDIMGLAASDGKVRSRSSPEYVSVWWNARGRIGIGDCPSEAAVEQGLAGSCLIVSNGVCVARPEDKLAPRTALGADRSGQVLWLVVVDGRQPGFSEGMSYPELADQMRQLGCWKAAALDGGGSSIMGVAGANGVLAVANSPSDRDSQGRAKIRPVPVVLTLEATSGR